ncbi:MAG: hypothetical protein HYY29_01770, partial [Chloroflexi bacterium]|nr:hypothetical protein [Chloroflexota bacterium]
SRRQRDRAGEIASRVQYLELSAAAGFSRTFASATYLGSYRLKHGLREIK